MEDHLAEREEGDLRSRSSAASREGGAGPGELGGKEGGEGPSPTPEPSPPPSER